MSVRGARLNSLRAGVATLVWWLAACGAFVLAAAVLLRTLRADAAATPWQEWFGLADALTPGALAEVEVPDWAWLRADAWGSAFGWALASVAWLLVGLVVVLLVRPTRARPARAVSSYSRPAGDVGAGEGGASR